MPKYRTLYILLIPLVFGCGTMSKRERISFANLERPVFSEVTAHDPSVILAGGTFYIFGSHLQTAKTDDLMNWTQIAESAAGIHPFFGNAREKFAECLRWAESNTFWAPDMIRLEDGRFFFYYNSCRGDSPLSAMGIAVADNIEGPYEDLGLILKSGRKPYQPHAEEPDAEYNGMQEDRSYVSPIYNANIHPNVVDPHVFFDNDKRLWMMYGSYSGGIFILELDPRTGFPFEGQEYGEKMLGGNHLRIEGPYVVYSPETGYYYMFLSFGGLTADGGYNIRVVRSKKPNGPYYDASGQAMIEAKGSAGSFFEDSTAERFGSVLMRSHRFLHMEGEPGPGIDGGYVSPGHNSVYRDEKTGRYFLIFHTRFVSRGEYHRVRVHQMFLNEDGWFVAAPHRYSNQELLDCTNADIAGDYKFILHQREISADITDSTLIRLNRNGAISGSVKGRWSYKTENHYIDLNIDGITYKGVVSHQWNEDAESFVMTFSAMSGEGISVWGSKAAGPGN